MVWTLNQLLTSSAFSSNPLTLSSKAISKFYSISISLSYQLPNSTYHPHHHLYNLCNHRWKQYQSGWNLCSSTNEAINQIIYEHQRNEPQFISSTACIWMWVLAIVYSSSKVENNCLGNSMESRWLLSLRGYLDCPEFSFFHFTEQDKTTARPHQVFIALISQRNVFPKYLVFLDVPKKIMPVWCLWESTNDLLNKATQMLIKVIIQDNFNWWYRMTQTYRTLIGMLVFKERFVINRV